ncbi:MAG: tetratricopeptide repeat protein, partial [Myxococcota bacterium]|nr:tetratricopeptide repeat protein [Myxococcota bacterium]
GVCALTPWGLWRALGIRRQAARPVAIAAALGIAALAFATVQRNAVWNDNVALWQDAAMKAPARAVSHLNLGVSFLTVGRLDDARRALLEAVRLDAKAHTAHQNLGSLAVGQGRFADAEPHFRRALAIEAADPISIAGMGAVAMEAGRPDEAIRLHERSLAIRIDPRIQTNLGQIFVVQGEFERGRRELSHSLSIDPKQPVAWQRLAEANEALGDFDRAADALEAFARYDPEIWRQPDFVLRLVVLYERSGRVDRATEALVFAAQRAREQGRVAEAEAFAARAATLSDRPE